MGCTVSAAGGGENDGRSFAADNRTVPAVCLQALPHKERLAPSALVFPIRRLRTGLSGLLLPEKRKVSASKSQKGR